jgi:hypothetical protein
MDFLEIFVNIKRDELRMWWRKLVAKTKGISSFNIGCHSMDVGCNFDCAFNDIARGIRQLFFVDELINIYKNPINRE